MNWLAGAVREALRDLAGPVEEWVRYDRKRMESHVRGSVGAQARIDKIDPRPTESEIRDMLREVLAQDHGVTLPG